MNNNKLAQKIVKTLILYDSGDFFKEYPKHKKRYMKIYTNRWLPIVKGILDKAK